MFVKQIGKDVSILFFFFLSPVFAVGSGSSGSLEPSGLVSPCSTGKSLSKELQHSLDLASATSGDKVVTAQVSNMDIILVRKWFTVFNFIFFFFLPLVFEGK